MSMFGFIEGPEAIIVLLVILVLFGGSQLPKLARSLGEAQRELKKAFGAHNEHDDNGDKVSKSDESPTARPTADPSTT